MKQNFMKIVIVFVMILSTLGFSLNSERIEAASAKPTASQVKIILEKAMALQRKTSEKKYTVSQIKTIMKPGFTFAYTSKYIKYDFYKDGKDKNGYQLYTLIQTDAPWYYLFPLDWSGKQTSIKKPTITISKKNGKEYLIVSQVRIDEGITATIYLVKSGKSWIIYNYTQISDGQ